MPFPVIFTPGDNDWTDCHDAQGVKDGKLPSGRNATHDVILEQLNVGGRGLLITVNGFGMPIFKDLLSDKEKEKIIAYVMSL
jgi:mono/diheme cytochrome c family protein